MYDSRKEDEVIIYLAQRLEPAYPPKVIDVLYLAEKLHLSRYGRTITGGQWWANHVGPVPRRWRDGDPESDGNYTLAEGPRLTFATSNLYWQRFLVRPLREPDSRELSRTDEECLDEVIRQSQERDDGETYDEARDWAWEQAIDGLAEGHHAPMPLLAIALTLPNALEVVKLLYQEGQLPDDE